MQCIWNYWHQAERKLKGTIGALVDTKHQTGGAERAGGAEPVNNLRPAPPVDRDESLTDDDGDIQVVSFNQEKPPQFTALRNGPADNLPIPFHRTNLLDNISEEDSEAESYINELPPYSLVESINTQNINNGGINNGGIKNGGIDTTERNYFSRYRYETFNDKTFSRTELDFTKFRKTMREVLPVKDTKTSLKRKRFTQNKLFQGQRVLQGHS